MNIGAWSAVRVALVAALWPILVLAFVAFQLFRLSSRHGAVFASAGILEAVLLLFGPPLVLVLVWLVLRSRAA